MEPEHLRDAVLGLLAGEVRLRFRHDERAIDVVTARRGAHQPDDVIEHPMTDVRIGESVHPSEAGAVGGEYLVADGRHRRCPTRW